MTKINSKNMHHVFQKLRYDHFYKIIFLIFVFYFIYWNFKFYQFKQIFTERLNKVNKIVYSDQDYKSKELIVIYNRIPKTGSTTFIGIAYDLCWKKHFSVLHVNISKNSHVLSLARQYQFVHNVTNWNSKKPSLYHGHFAYIDFVKLGARQKPLYINIIRNPLERFISYFYFLRHGDDFRPHLHRKYQGDTMTLDECVEKNLPDCSSEKIWLQVPFFCGQSPACWKIGNRWALEKAKYHLLSKYLLVGVTEQIDDFIWMLEIILPQFFDSALHLYRTGKRKHLRKTANKIIPTNATQSRLAASVAYKLEQEFYQFAKQQFNEEFHRMKLTHAMKFHYEKIKPK